MKSVRIALLGAGAHAWVVLDLLREVGLAGRIRACVDLHGNRRLGGRRLSGVPILEGSDFPRLLRQLRIGAVVPAVGDNALRRAACKRARDGGFALLSATHPSAIVSRRAEVGPGAHIGAAAVVGTSAQIGEGAIVNTAAIVDHDGRVGPYAHVAPGARLAGNVRVGPSAFVGIGVSVRQGIRIGEGAIVGAGAVVVRNIPAGVTVAGIPARTL